MTVKILANAVLSLGYFLSLVCCSPYIVDSATSGGMTNSTKIIPTLTFTPSAGAVGTLVTLSGMDFTTVQSVKIGGVTAVPITTSTTDMIAFVMPGATSSKVSVVTPEFGTVSSSNSFTVTATGVPLNQQGSKKVGNSIVSAAPQQGYAVALNADGNTGIVGGFFDNTGAGATWVFTRNLGVWTQQAKLVGTGGIVAQQGTAVAISADGNTVLIGGSNDDSHNGAAWIFTRSNGVWTQQGSKMIGSGSIGAPLFGQSVALSADGNTALVGGWGDDTYVGAAWVYIRSNGVWTQQGPKLIGGGWSVALSADGDTALVADFSGVGRALVYKRTLGVWSQQSILVGTGEVGSSGQGSSVALSADGNTALVGGMYDNSSAGATWVFTRNSGVWTQQGSKLVGTGAVNAGGGAQQGTTVALSADGNTAIIGGPNDNSGAGATWVFTRSAGVWTQQGSKWVGTGAVGPANQGQGIAISSDGHTAIVGGYSDDSSIGAFWTFTP